MTKFLIELNKLIKEAAAKGDLNRYKGLKQIRDDNDHEMREMLAFEYSKHLKRGAK